MNILAVVVSYNGGAKTLATVAALREQVDRVHVVDNGSTADCVASLRQLSADPAVTLTLLGQNLGIAAALNHGVRWAREADFPWILTMDQDTRIGAGMIAAFADKLRDLPQAVCLVPNVVDRGSASAPADGPVDFAITSGTLVRTRVFDEIGLFDESLFIDGVDIDFSLRVRQRGHQIYRVGGAAIHHELGEAHDGPRWLARVYSQHSPLRRYYMYRNHLHLMRRYWRKFPGFILKATAYQCFLLLLVAFYDREPLRSFRYIARGVRDYFGGRMGRYQQEG